MVVLVCLARALARVAGVFVRGLGLAFVLNQATDVRRLSKRNKMHYPHTKPFIYQRDPHSLPASSPHLQRRPGEDVPDAEARGRLP